MADLATPAAPAAAPAAPSAPAAAAPAPAPAPVSAPAPVAAPAAPAGGAPAEPAAPAVVAVPAAAAAAPAKYDPKTAAAPPSSADYPDNAQGIADFIRENTEWSQSHPEEAEKNRAAKIAAEDGGEVTQAETAIAAEVAKVDGEQPKVEEAKPADAPAAAATPAKIEEWTTKSPELKAVFEKHPELQAEIMETARFAESMKQVADIVSTPEEATFAVEHAQRLVSLQTNWMLSGEDPDMIAPAWDMTVDMFKERDGEGKEVLGADGKPKLGADFKPFVRKAASNAMEEYATAAQAQIAAIEARLNGVYPNEEAKAADATTLENAKYEKAAFDFVLGKLGQKDDSPALPALPPNATPEQIEFQKRLEAQQKDLDAKAGKQTTESRKTARVALDREVQDFYEAGVTKSIDSHITDMKARGEYLPDFVLNDKYINPATGKATNVSAFGAKIYLALNNKINSNPLHAAKLGNLQALGAGGKEARQAEITRLQNFYLPDLIKAEVTRIQNGIRETSGKPKDNTGGGIARVEPQSAGTTQPATMDSTQTRVWAETEAAKDPSYSAMDSRTREQLIITLAAKKKYGG